MAHSPTPWRAQVDHINDRYARVYDGTGRSIARVYYPAADVACFVAAPAILEVLVRIINGHAVDRPMIRELIRRAGYREDLANE